MNISMSILAYELKDLPIESDIKNDGMTIQGIRFFDEGSVMSDHYVYISDETNGRSADTTRVVLSHQGSTIRITGPRFESVINRVNRIFEKYNEWSIELRSAMYKDDVFQRVLDVAHEVFATPMFFGHKSRMVFAITRQYTDKDVYEGWDEFKKELRITPHIAQIIQIQGYKPYMDVSRQQSLDPLQPNATIRYQLRTNVYYEGSVYGHLYIYGYEEKPDEAIWQLAKYVGGIFSEILKYYGVKNTLRFQEMSWVIDAIEGKELTPYQITHLASLAGTDRFDYYELFKFELNDNKLDNAILWLVDQLDSLNHTLSLPYGSAVVMLRYCTQGEDQSELQRLKEILSYCDFDCGISFAFSDIKDIGTAWKQAGMALDYAKERFEKIHMFRDCALLGISREFMDVTAWKPWIMPELLSMAKGDSEGGKEYYNTLSAYLENGCSPTATSKALFLHKNTLLYRIKKIESILGVELNDQATAEYLHLCCLMLDYSK